MVRKITWVSMMPAALPSRTTGSDCPRATCGAATSVVAPAPARAVKRRRVIMLVSFSAHGPRSLLHLSPRAGLSGEKLGIAELHLVWASALLAVAGVDRCRFADLRNRASREQELADELSETDWQHGDAVDPRRDAQQQIGDHRREDLQPNGVLVVAEELADREMLLDPAEQQFDLPSALVERGDLHGRALKIIGEQGDDAALVAPHPDAPQRDRQPG